MTQSGPIRAQSLPIKSGVSSNKLRDCVFLKLITSCLLIYLGHLMVSGTEKCVRVYTQEFLYIVVHELVRHKLVSAPLTSRMKPLLFFNDGLTKES